MLNHALSHGSVIADIGSIHKSTGQKMHQNSPENLAKSAAEISVLKLTFRTIVFMLKKRCASLYSFVIS